MSQNARHVPVPHVLVSFHYWHDSLSFLSSHYVHYVHAVLYIVDHSTNVRLPAHNHDQTLWFLSHPQTP
jgi:hypothetical protein